MQSEKSGGQVVDEPLYRRLPKVAGSISFPYVEKTAVYLITDLDYSINCTANTFAVTLPTAVGHNRVYVVSNTGAGVITLTPDGAELIDGAATQAINAAESLTVQSTGAGWIII